MSIFGRWAVLLIALFVSSRSLTATAHETHQVVAFENAAFTIKINRPQQLCELLQKWSEDFHEDPQQRPTLEQTQEGLLYWLELEGTKGIDFTREMWVGAFLNDDFTFHLAIVCYPQAGSADRIQLPDIRFSQQFEDRVILTDKKELFEAISLVNSDSNQWVNSQAYLRCHPQRLFSFYKMKLNDGIDENPKFGMGVSNGVPYIRINGQDVTWRLSLSCQGFTMLVFGLYRDQLEQSAEAASAVDFGIDLDKDAADLWMRIADPKNIKISKDEKHDAKPEFLVPDFDPHATVRFTGILDRSLLNERMGSLKSQADKLAEEAGYESFQASGVKVIQGSFSLQANGINGIAQGGVLFLGNDKLDVANIKSKFLEYLIKQIPKGQEGIEKVVMIDDEVTANKTPTGEMLVNPDFRLDLTGLLYQEIVEAKKVMHRMTTLFGVDLVLAKYVSNSNTVIFATGGNDKQFRDFVDQNITRTPKMIDIEKTNPLPVVTIVQIRPMQAFRDMGRIWGIQMNKNVHDVIENLGEKVSTLSLGDNGAEFDLHLQIPRSVFVGLHQMAKDDPASEIDPAFR